MASTKDYFTLNILADQNQLDFIRNQAEYVKEKRKETYKTGDISNLK